VNKVKKWGQAFYNKKTQHQGGGRSFQKTKGAGECNSDRPQEQGRMRRPKKGVLPIGRENSSNGRIERR